MTILKELASRESKEPCNIKSFTTETDFSKSGLIPKIFVPSTSPLWLNKDWLSTKGANPIISSFFFNSA